VRSKCMNNLKQLALGLHGHNDEFYALPTATLYQDGLPVEKRLSWCVAVLPFLEQDQLYKTVDLQAPWDAASNGKTRVNDDGTQIFRCPSATVTRSEDGTALTNYV